MGNLVCHAGVCLGLNCNLGGKIENHFHLNHMFAVSIHGTISTTRHTQQANKVEEGVLRKYWEDAGFGPRLVDRQRHTIMQISDIERMICGGGRTCYRGCATTVAEVGVLSWEGTCWQFIPLSDCPGVYSSAWEGKRRVASAYLGSSSSTLKTMYRWACLASKLPDVSTHTARSSRTARSRSVCEGTLLTVFAGRAGLLHTCTCSSTAGT